MSQNFKLKFDEMREGQPSGENQQNDQSETYDTHGHVRNICFVWPDGRMKFLSYVYLVSGEYSPDDGSITLVFTSETVVIKGSGLEKLLLAFLSQSLKKVGCSNMRYDLISYRNNVVITHIEIMQR